MRRTVPLKASAARMKRTKFRGRPRGAAEKRATAWTCPECARTYPYGDPGPTSWKDCCQRCGSPDFVRAQRAGAERSAAPHPKRLKRSRVKPMSAKRKKLLPERTALLLGLKALVGWRCEFCGNWSCRPLDGHEVRKPRSKYWLNPEYVVILGRPHHEMAEASYKSGRLEIPGTRSAGWGFAVVYAASKFTRNADALTGPLRSKRTVGDVRIGGA